MGNARGESCGLSTFFPFLLCPMDLLALQHLSGYIQPQSDPNWKFFDLQDCKPPNTHSSVLGSFSHESFCLLSCLFHNQPGHQQKFFPESWYRRGGTLDNPNTNAIASLLALGKSPSFFCSFVFPYLTVMIHRSKHPTFKAPLHLIPFDAIYFTTLGSSQKIGSSHSLVFMSNYGWAV